MLGLVLAGIPVANASGDAPAEPVEARVEVVAAPPAAATAARARIGRVRLKVVATFADTRQALVLDRDSGKHVVLGEGERIGKYEIVEIEGDEVIVRIGAREVLLIAEEPKTAAAPVAPVATPAPVIATPAPVTATPVIATPAGPSVMDPYADEASDAMDAMDDAEGEPMVAIEGGPIDPYAPMMVAPAAPLGTPAGPSFGAIDPNVPVREVIAPDGQRAPMAPVPAPLVESPAAAPAVVTVTPIVAPPSPVTATPAPVTVTAAPLPEVPNDAIRVESMTIARPELTAALADFDRLEREVGFARTGNGIKLSRVPVGSYFHKLGFRSGDVVTAIDGTQLLSLDDAALVYVRLGSAKKLAVDLRRGDTHGQLRFALK